MSRSRAPKPPSPDSCQRALGNKEKAFSKIYRKSVTGRVRAQTIASHPRANWLPALPGKLQFPHKPILLKQPPGRSQGLLLFR